MVMNRKGNMGGAPSGLGLNAGAETTGFATKAPTYMRIKRIIT